MKSLILSFLSILMFLSCKEQDSNKKSALNSSSKCKTESIKTGLDSISLKGIKEIPQNILKNNQLTYLSVYGQDCDVAGIECLAINNLPKEIKNLENLEVLKLILNYIEKLPNEILELKKLRVLDLTENPNFSDLKTVGKIKWLKEFCCYGCNISEKEIQDLKKELPGCTIGH